MPTSLRVVIFSAATCVAMFFGSLESSAADTPSYSGNQLEIKEAVLTDSGKVQITFSTIPETLYYCPGADGKTTEEGTVLTFVRASIKKKPKVTYPAKQKGDPTKTLDRLILCDAMDKPVFVRTGKELIKIFPVD